MTLEDIDDPKWAAYDKKQTKGQAKDNAIPKDSNKEWHDEVIGDGKLEELILSVDWNIAKSVVYEKHYKNITLSISVVAVRSSVMQEYNIKTTILTPNPEYGPNQEGSKKYLTHNLPESISTRKIIDRQEAEKYIWGLIQRFEKKFNKK